MTAKFLSQQQQKIIAVKSWNGNSRLSKRLFLQNRLNTLYPHTARHLSAVHQNTDKIELSIWPLVGLAGISMLGYENNNNNNKILLLEEGNGDDVNNSDGKEEKLEIYVSRMKREFEKIRINASKKLHLPESAEKFLNSQRTVRIVKESPYMLSFTVVNVFDVLASLTSNENFKDVQFHHTKNKNTMNSNVSSNDTLLQVSLDSETSFILFKEKNSNTARLQIYTENIPNDRQIDLMLNAYNTAWGSDTFLNGWGSILKSSLRPPFTKHKSNYFNKPVFNSSDIKSSDDFAGVKEQLKSMGVAVYDKSDDEAKHSDWSTLAGYEHVKREVDDTVLLALKHPEEYLEIAKKTRKKLESNQPKAILFDGPPGTGKTTTARIIASETDVPLVYVPIESLMSKWYGEGEKTLAKIFDLCDAMGDAILFIDEVDALATSRNDTGMHEATRRLLSVLLRRIDGFQKEGRNTLTICATNRKDDLDPALISRFDLSVNFNLPDMNERFDIFKMYAKQLSDSDIKILAKMSKNMAGRDIKDVCLHAERKFASLKIRKRISKLEEAPNVNHYKEALVTRINGSISDNDNGVDSSNGGVEV
eukprot:g5712.t1